MNLKMILGSLGFDASEVTGHVAAIQANVAYTATEIAAQGAMIRNICKHLELPVIPQAALPGTEIDHDGGQ